jgi:CubicO group peptidase (beta-lactamase class C family)
MFAPATVAIARIDTYLAARMREGTFSGVVLVADGRRIIFNRAYGLANREDGTPNTVNTLFRIASMTKPLVATTALALAERKQLDLDASICASLSSCPPAWQPTTLRNLLTFTSGIPDLFDSVAAVPPDQLPSAVDAAIRSAKPDELNLRFVSGTNTAYSNFNYLLVAYAIQHATNRSWLAAMDEFVLQAARMRATRYDDAYAIVSGRARGYRIVGSHLENTKYEDDGGLSAGGMLSTSGDIYRFVLALQSGELIDTQMLHVALTPDSAGFGYGWQIATFFGAAVDDFTGGTNGFSSNVSYYPGDGLTVVVLSNLENAGAKGLSCDVGAIVHGIQPRDAALSFEPISAINAAILGTYAGEDGVHRTFSLGTGGLQYQSANSPTAQAIVADGVRRYALADHPDVVFDLSTDGRHVLATSCGATLFDARR